jgi:hypothetical protein
MIETIKKMRLLRSTRPALAGLSPMLDLPFAAPYFTACLLCLP